MFPSYRSTIDSFKDTKIKIGEVRYDIAMATGEKPHRLPFPEVAQKAKNGKVVLSDIEVSKQSFNSMVMASFAFEALVDIRAALGMQEFDYNSLGNAPYERTIKSLLNSAQNSFVVGLEILQDLVARLQTVETVTIQAQNSIASIMNTLSCCMIGLATQPIEVRIGQYEKVTKQITDLVDSFSSKGSILSERKLHKVRRLICSSAQLMFDDYEGIAKQFNNHITVNKAKENFKALRDNKPAGSEA